MMWWGYDHMSGWGYALMGLSTLVFWGLVVTAIVLPPAMWSGPPARGLLPRRRQQRKSWRSATHEVRSAPTSTAPGWTPCERGGTTRFSADPRTLSKRL